jgi:hypothetical protein
MTRGSDDWQLMHNQLTPIINTPAHAPLNFMSNRGVLSIGQDLSIFLSDAMYDEFFGFESLLELFVL